LAIRTNKLGEILDYRMKIRFTTIGRDINSIIHKIRLLGSSLIETISQSQTNELGIEL
jgi:hypothetical protein